MYKGISKLVLLSLLFTQLYSYAQTTEREISFGFRAGYVNTTLYGSYVEFSRSSTTTGTSKPVNSKSSFEIAASVYYQVYKPIFITTGIGFIQKGGDIENFTPLYPVDVTLNYLNIPVGVSVRAIQGKKFSIFADGGFVFNYEVSSEQDFKKGIDPTEETTESKFIVSYSLGGSCRYKVSETFSVQVEAHYLNDINPFFTQVIYEDLEMKTKGKVFSLGVVYKWR
jgi:hypothetical protein